MFTGDLQGREYIIWGLCRDNIPLFLDYLSYCQYDALPKYPLRVDIAVPLVVQYSPNTFHRKELMSITVLGKS